MKKIIFTTVAALAISSSAFAMQASKIYLKSGLGNSLLNSKGITDYEQNFGNSPSGLTGTVGIGYVISNMLGIEACIDYTNTSAKHISILGIKGFDSKFSEKTINLSSKAFIQHSLDEKLSLNIGIGTGMTSKYAKHRFSDFIPLQGKDKTELQVSKLSSKRFTKPLGLISIGTNYIINDDIVFGVEYSAKFNSKDNYKTTKDFTLKDAQVSGLEDYPRAKGMFFAKSSSIDRSMTANIKFSF